MRIALSQMNAVVGDIAGNERRIREGIAAAREGGARLVLFPELAVSGYPPEDLLLKEHFLADVRAAVERLAPETDGIVAVVGFPERADDVYNAAAVLADGELRGVYRKVHLPNYGVFDEMRYFQSGPSCGAVIEIDGVRVGLTICEDIWVPGAPGSDEALAGATLIVNISASPYQLGKGLRRERMVAQRAADNFAVTAFCALVGGQDELVFDGHSFVCDHEGNVIARAPQFAEHLLFCDVDTDAAASARLRETRQRPAAREAQKDVPELAASGEAPDDGPRAEVGGEVAGLLDPDAEVYAALVLATHDYVTKNGFEHVVIGLSGGIDSTLVLLVAVDALGADRVTCVTMPSRYSSEGTRSDARTLAENLGVELLELPIAEPMRAYDELLAEPFAGREPDLTEENLQSRIRGVLLMALSNKLGWMVLTTGNKSESAVGYSTLYGDTAGGFAVIKDVPKLVVYDLCRLVNTRSGHEVIPEDVLTKPPSAELRPDQKDQDSLPPYEVLDPILEAYVEHDLTASELVDDGFDPALVQRVVRMVDRAEYKRRQNPPGVRVTPKAFGKDRRVPITNRYPG